MLQNLANSSAYFQNPRNVTHGCSYRYIADTSYRSKILRFFWNLRYIHFCGHGGRRQPEADLWILVHGQACQAAASLAGGSSWLAVPIKKRQGPLQWEADLLILKHGQAFYSTSSRRHPCRGGRQGLFSCRSSSLLDLNLAAHLWLLLHLVLFLHDWRRSRGGCSRRLRLKVAILMLMSADEWWCLILLCSFNVLLLSCKN